LPADDVPAGPPVLDPGVVALGDHHIRPAARFLRLARIPEDLELVEPLQVKADAGLLCVDLEHVVVLAPAREAGRLERAERAVLELAGGDEGVVHADLPHLVAAGDWALGDERLGVSLDALDAADEVVRQVDDVRTEVAERAGAG